MNESRGCIAFSRTAVAVSTAPEKMGETLPKKTAHTDHIPASRSGAVRTPMYGEPPKRWNPSENQHMSKKRREIQKRSTYEMEDSKIPSQCFVRENCCSLYVNQNLLSEVNKAEVINCLN